MNRCLFLLASFVVLKGAVTAGALDTQRTETGRKSTLEDTERKLQGSPFAGWTQFFQNAWHTKTSWFDCFGGSTTTTISNFTIALDLQGVDDDSEFQNAVAKWSQVIVGDITDYTGTLGGSSSCGPWPSSIDDVYICGRYEHIDGPGNVLGAASPRHFRPTEGIPITGEMKFETVDVEETIQDLMGVILHEMAHVLGIGSMWAVNGLTTGFSVPCPYKLDSAASREYQALSGCSGVSIPLEQDNPNSNCGHWAENCFTNEVMTSAANSELPISRLTLAGLEDLGYQVDYSQADDYGTANINPSCLCYTNARSLVDEDNVHELTPGQGRQLSKEGRESAIEYGEKMLAEIKGLIQPIGPQSDAIDLGGYIIYVLYLEDDTVYSVLVTAPRDQAT